jgi:quinohemoprotein ethanol dehydrogenase
VVFQGTADGRFCAYDARTGARLWSEYVGMGIIGAPMTYESGGVQYVSVLAGYGGSAAAVGEIMNVGWKYRDPRRILTFALGGRAELPKSDPPTLKVNFQDDPAEQIDLKQAAIGKSMSIACAACHGRNLVSAGGPAPDLRESAVPLNPDAFFAVVHDGALIQRGMPAFAFGKPQIEALRQYVRATTRAAMANPHPQTPQ